MGISAVKRLIFGFEIPDAPVNISMFGLDATLVYMASSRIIVIVPKV